MFDVGIAEEHAMSMAGGLAKQGMIPVIALYSTFLQRSYDMILQDVCMLGLHVVLAVDRAGLVGEDGETHHGIFDVGFLRQAPGMQILCPASTVELQQMLRWATLEQTDPVAIRYPRGGNGVYSDSAWDPQATAVVHKTGRDAVIITYGTLVNNAMVAADSLKGQGIDAGVIRLISLKPLPVDFLATAIDTAKYVLILEEICDGSGVYEALAWQLRERLPNCKFSHVDLGDRYITHGSMEKLYHEYGLDSQSIVKHIQEVLKVEN
jgi:1-deoxy-D-xylulose-5-phosphate synthase